MTLPGQEDTLLFQKKTSDMKKLGPITLIHADGSVVFFQGARLEDNKPYVNRFLYKPGQSHTVVIDFDSRKHHQYWKCGCGGINLPYYICSHLRYLEIIPNVSDDIAILTSEEFLDLSPDKSPEEQRADLEKLLISEPPPYLGCGKILHEKGKRLFADKGEEI